MIDYIILLPQVIERVTTYLDANDLQGVSPVNSVKQVFNLDNQDILYRVINQTIRIYSEDYHLDCYIADEKNSLKAGRIHKNRELDYEHALNFGAILKGNVEFILVSETNRIPKSEDNSQLHQFMENYNYDYFDREGYTSYYWGFQKETLKIGENQNEKQTYASVSMIREIRMHDLEGLLIKIIYDNDAYFYQNNDHIRIVTNEDWQNSQRATDLYRNRNVLLGEVVEIDRDNNSLIVQTKLSTLSKIKDQNYDGGHLWVSDSGFQAKNRNEKQALQKMYQRKTANPDLKLFIPDIMNAGKTTLFEKEIDKKYFSPNMSKMNEHQKQSVLGSIHTEDIFLIQGPPGTGKTTVISELLYYLAYQNQKILLASQTHLGVDNVLQRIGDEDHIDALRIGKEDRIELGNEKYVLENRVEDLQNTIIESVDKKEAKYKEYLENKDELEKDYSLFKKVIIHADSIIRLNEELIELDESLAQSQENLSEEQTEYELKKEKLELLTSKLSYPAGDYINFSKILKLNIDRHNLLLLLQLYKESDFIELNRLDIYQFNRELTKVNNEVKQLNTELSALKMKERRVKGQILANEKYRNSSIISGYSVLSELNIEKNRITEDIARIDTQKRIMRGKTQQKWAHVVPPLKRVYEADQENIPLLKKRSFKEYLDLITKYELFDQADICPPEDFKKVEEEMIYYKKQLNLKNVVFNIREEVKTLEEAKSLIKKKIQTLTDKQEQLNQGAVQIYLGKHEKDFNAFSYEDREYLSNHIEEFEGIDSFNEQYEATREIQKEWKNRLEVYEQSFETYYLRRANVISATCAGIASSRNNEFNETVFDYVVIDEASRSSTLELIVPMVRGQKIVLVGDHRQISPEIEREIIKELEKEGEFSKEKIDEYKKSLFGELFMKADENNREFLDYQYRMHPDISKVVSDNFYEGDLKNGPNVVSKKHGILKLPQALHWVDTGSNGIEYIEKMDGFSAYNEGEIELTVDFLHWLDNELTETKSVGIIAPYKAHMLRLEQRLASEQFSWIDFEVNTIDAFQGRERQIMIINFVRNNDAGKVGFIQEDSRLNVALSRAQELMILIGSIPHMKKNRGKVQTLNHIIQRLEEHNAVFPASYFKNC